MANPNDPNDPNNPYTQQDYQQNNYIPQEQGEPEEELVANRRGPALRSGPGKLIAMGVVGGGVVLYILYGLLFGNAKPVKSGSEIIAANPIGGGVSPPPATISAPISMPSIAPVPPPPAPPAPPPPPPPPIAPSPIAALPDGEIPAGPADGVIPPPPLPSDLNSQKPGAPAIKSSVAGAGAGDKDAQRRMRANMLVMDGGAVGSSKTTAQAAATAASDTAVSADPNVAFSKAVLSATGAESATATRLSNLNQLIAQGKMIDAVLETAINTDLPGTLRGIISRDVYAESGHAVMIPKGSRIIGTYNTGILRGQRRVMIVWTRLIRPDGVDIAIGSPATDTLGRAGIGGEVDNKYFETFSAAILTSILSVGVAIGADALTSEPSTTTQRSDGSSSSTGSAGAAAAASSVGTLGGIGRDVVDGLLDLRPTITIDQGSRINVFVNRDLIFPKDDNTAAGNFVQ